MRRLASFDGEQISAGSSLGLYLFDRVDDKRFRQIVLLFLLFSGIVLMT
jgi:uncharacterized membrane protein YfcA